MGAGFSGHFHGTKGGRMALHTGRQGKHIVGNKNYISGRSIFFGTIEEAQQLVREFAGKGTRLGQNKERVDFGRIKRQYSSLSMTIR